MACGFGSRSSTARIADCRRGAARLKYIISPAGLVDLVAVMPFWFSPFLPNDLRVLQVFRMVRFFKIARYSPAMRSLLDVFIANGARCSAVW